MITEFTLKVLLFDINRGFSVLYTPNNCDNCTPITQWVRLPPSQTESAIFDHLCNSAPYEVWQRQLQLNNSFYPNLVGYSFVVNATTATISHSITGPTINPFESNFANDIRSELV